MSLKTYHFLILSTERLFFLPTFKTFSLSLIVSSLIMRCYGFLTFNLLGFVELEPGDFYQIRNIFGSYASQFIYITSFLIRTVSIVDLTWRKIQSPYHQPAPTTRHRSETTWLVRWQQLPEWSHTRPAEESSRTTASRHIRTNKVWFYSIKFGLFIMQKQIIKIDYGLSVPSGSGSLLAPFLTPFHTSSHSVQPAVLLAVPQRGQLSLDPPPGESYKACLFTEPWPGTCCTPCPGFLCSISRITWPTRHWFALCA